MDAAWGNFFSAQVAGSSALVGLLFVGLSLNLPQILTGPGLASRALLALIQLLMVMVLSLAFLVPGLDATELGIAVAAFGGLTWMVGTLIQLSIARRWTQPRRTLAINFAVFEIACLPYLLGTIQLLRGDLGGIYWVAGAMILFILKAASDAWVLLVEIKR